MLESLDRCRRDSTLFQFTSRPLRDFTDPNHLLIQIDEQLDFAKLAAPLEERLRSAVAVQHECPSHRSAEMSPGWSAMVSDGDTVDATGDRRVGGLSASMYLLTVSL